MRSPRPLPAGCAHAVLDRVAGEYAIGPAIARIAHDLPRIAARIAAKTGRPSVWLALPVITATVPIVIARTIFTLLVIVAFAITPWRRAILIIIVRPGRRRWIILRLRGQGGA